ncbi:hypothetical protein Aspvir_009927 [Aspergillus viridinutans]|uniref:Major facilitator superfamily (MFS) profile domain-containing protein n=1 Tax=Aspergillus viridinutans TaxID=75553 RepID=A0A9P3C8Q6_ASPVI|nr:uncharacterized protein Aspvir_009927 [Aspergillus viridinutans]GIK05814.1 hypothetical protein Aspvir_009927 [Aspergillus viridinutans]
MSGIIGAQNRFGRDFNNPDAAMQGDITALYDISCVVGSIVCYFIGERFGRRTILMAGGALMVLGTCTRVNARRRGSGGALLTLQGTVTILGVVIAYWMDYGTSFTESSFQWRFPLSFQSVFAPCLILQVIGLPETPRWLVQHDRHEEARAVIAAIEDKPLADETRPLKFAELFTVGETQNLRRLLLTISIELGQQFTGSNMINYYAPVLFQQNMHMSRNLALVLGGPVPVFRDGFRFSSRWTLFYGVGWLPVPWFYPAEINTTRVRTKMQAIASGWNWMAVFAVLNAAFIPMVYCFYPETKGLEDIPLLFAKGGVTGDVLTSKGGRTVTPGQHARDVQVDRKVEVREMETAA